MSARACVLALVLLAAAACDDARRGGGGSSSDTSGASSASWEEDRSSPSAIESVRNFERYMYRSKEVEAQTNLKRITDGARAYYFQERATSPDGLTIETALYPASPEWSCTSTGGLGPDEEAPRASDFERDTVFGALRFDIQRPHRYRYCYRASADRTRFVAYAEADLDDRSSIDSRHCVSGAGEELTWPEPVASQEACAARLD